MQDYSDSVSFLRAFFKGAKGAVELRACPNERGPKVYNSIIMDPAHATPFCVTHDQPGTAVYFGTCTRQPGLQGHGGKEHVICCPTLWVDIDCAKQGIAGVDAIAALEFLPFPPTIIINSGAGLHAYWELEEPQDVSSAEKYQIIEALNRQLVMILAGDPSCTEIARIMRLPGTMNSKDATRALNDGEALPCSVLSATERVYDLGALTEWLSEQRAVLHGKVRAEVRAIKHDDPFVAYAREAGYEPAIDIEAQLAAMEYESTGENSIHKTQIRVSMSMIARGYEDDEIVSLILAATEDASPRDKQWNWAVEEKAIRGMIFSGRKKTIKRPESAVREVISSSGSGGAGGGGAALAVVHDIEKARAKKPDKESKGSTVIIGRAAIGVWQDRYGPVMHTGGLTYAYSEGIWVLWDERLAQRLRAIIQEACASLKIEPKTALLNAAKAYFMDRPEMTRDDVEFDCHGLIIAEDYAVDPKDGSLVPHSPEHFARYKVGTKAEGGHEVASWTAFLAETFSDCPAAEGKAIIATLQEWFGAVLIINKSRSTRMAMLVHGPSRTGKTQIAEVARGLIGMRHVSGAPMRDLEGRFGLEPFLGKRGWITDDAVGEGEFMDADTYKKIVTGEKMSVQCKGGRNVEITFGFPVLITMNNMPRVKEQSAAVYNRSLICHCTHVRPEKASEPVGYNSISEKILATEMTGLFWWAFEGWQRLCARGFFDPPKSMVDAREAFEADNNPVGTWREECLVIDPECKISRPDLLASMNGWWMQEYGVDMKPWSGRGFYPRLVKALPGYSKDSHETQADDGQRYLIGVRLNDAGLIAWDSFKGSRWGEATKLAEGKDRVNVKNYDVPTNPEQPADMSPRF